MKRLITIIVLLSVMWGCCACQPTPTMPPVASKNDSTLEKAIYESTDKGIHLDMPDSYSYSYETDDEKIHIVYDNVPVDASKASAFSVYEAVLSPLDSKQLQHIVDVCFPECESTTLHNNELTKDEITKLYLTPAQKYLWQLENSEIKMPVSGELAEDEVSEDEWLKTEIKAAKNRIEIYQKQAEKAPESVERTTYDLSKYKSGSELDIDIISADGSIGRIYISDGGEKKLVSFGAYYIENNNGSDEVSGAYAPFIYHGDNPTDDIKALDSMLNISQSEAKSRADEFIKSLNMTEYTYSDMGYGMGISSINAFIYTAYEEQEEDAYAYITAMRAVLYTRDIDGMNAAEYQAICDAAGKQYKNSDVYYEKPFCYEALTVWVDDDGVCGFTLKSPMKVTKIQDSVKVLDFERIRDRLEKQMKYVLPNSENIKGRIEKNGLCLEMKYAQIKRKDKQGFFLYIPVWCAYENSTVLDEKGRTAAQDESGFMGIPAYIINAIDGSIVDVNQGY